MQLQFSGESIMRFLIFSSQYNILHLISRFELFQFSNIVCWVLWIILDFSKIRRRLGWVWKFWLSKGVSLQKPIGQRVFLIGYSLTSSNDLKSSLLFYLQFKISQANSPNHYQCSMCPGTLAVWVQELRQYLCAAVFHVPGNSSGMCSNVPCSWKLQRYVIQCSLFLGTPAVCAPVPGNVPRNAVQ